MAPWPFPTQVSASEWRGCVYTWSQNGLGSSFASGCFLKSNLLAYVPTGPISLAFRERLHLDTGKKFFALRTTNHSNNFPRDVVETPSGDFQDVIISSTPPFPWKVELDHLLRSLPTRAVLWFADSLQIFCLCTGLLASVGVICHLGICLQEFSQGVLCVGDLHISYSVCGSREMGTLRGWGTTIGLFSPVICEH